MLQFEFRVFDSLQIYYTKPDESVTSFLAAQIYAEKEMSIAAKKDATLQSHCVQHDQKVQ